MKKNNLLGIILCAIIALSSCTKKNDTTILNTLTGDWHLVQYTPSDSQASEKRFNKGDVVWSFDQEKSEVSVTQKSGVDFNVVLPGNYNYNQGNGRSWVKGRIMSINNLTIDSMPLGRTTIIHNGMQIEELGGHMLVFERH